MEAENSLSSLFGAKLANKEIIAKKFENESSKRFYFNTCVNYLLFVYNFVRYAFYVWLPKASSAEEVASRQQLGDPTYNWGLSLRSYVCLLIFDIHLVGIATGYLFLFSRVRNDWIEVLDVLSGTVEAAAVGLFANAAGKSRKRLLKSTRFAFALSKWLLRLYLLAIIAHFFVLPFLMAFDYSLKKLLVEEFPKKIPFLFSIIPWQLWDTFVLFRLFPFLLASFCYFYITSLLIHQSTAKFNLICKVVLKNQLLLNKNKSDKIISYLVDSHNRNYRRLRKYNRFWSQFYSLFNVGLLVYNIPLTYLTLFEQVNIAVRILAVYGMTLSSAIIILMGYKTARLSTAFHRSYPLLNSIFSRCNKNCQIKLKVC